MNWKQKLKVRWLKLTNGGRVPFDKMDNEIVNHYINLKLEDWFYFLLESKSYGLGVNFLDSIDNLSGDIDLDDDIIFNTFEEFNVFHKNLFTKYSVAVISQFFQLILTLKAHDIQDVLTVSPIFNDDGIQVLPPHSNVDTRQLAEISMATTIETLPIIVKQIYRDPMELLYHAFPSIINFEGRSEYVKNLYKLISMSSTITFELFMKMMANDYDEQTTVKNHSMLMLSVMEYANDYLAGFYDQQGDELLLDGVRSEFIGVLFGLLHHLQESKDNKFLEFGPLNDCLSNLAMEDSKNLPTVKVYRKSAIALFIQTMGELRARIETTVNVAPDAEAKKDNVISIKSRRESEISMETVFNRYLDLANDIVKQIDEYGT